MEIEVNDIDFGKELRDIGAIKNDTIDVSKFLREDLSINLELLEIAIKEIVDGYHDLYVTGFSHYFKARKIQDKLERQVEEVIFIYEFTKAAANELSETGDKEIFLKSWK